MVCLLAGGRRVAAFKELSAKELMEMSPEQELDAKIDETDFAAAMCCLSILRWGWGWCPSFGTDFEAAIHVLPCLFVYWQGGRGHPCWGGRWGP